MSKLAESIKKASEFIITCEFVPGRGFRGMAVEEAVRFGQKVVESGLPIHAISITDNPGGNPAISPDTLAEELKKAGIEALIHLSCAGLNRNTIEGRLSGLARLGLSNLLVISGDYPVGGYQGRAKPVFDMDSVQVLSFIKEMNAGIELPGKAKDGTPNRMPATEFFTACSVAPFGKSEAELWMQFMKLEKKIAAGAGLVIPQLGYDIRKFAEVAKFLKYRKLQVPILGNCYVLSRPVGKFMNRGEVPGTVVTDDLMKVLEQEASAADKGKQARLERAARLVAIFRGLAFNGVHLGGFGLKFEDIQFIVNRSAELTPKWKEFIPDFRYGTADEAYFFPDDPALSFAPDTLIPVALKPKRFFSAGFTLSKIVHRMVFTQKTLGFSTGACLYRFLGKHRALNNAGYRLERIAKSLLFDCQECGDCALFSTGYVCPMSACAKFQRNGPCGGSRNGMCEADPEKKCVWVRAYERLAPAGKLDMVRDYIPPANHALAKTSSWSNYYLGKDHTGTPEVKAPSAHG